VEVHFYATLRAEVGEKTIEVELPEGATVRELIGRLVESRPRLADAMLDERGRLSRHVHLLVDGRSVRHLKRGVETPLRSDLNIDVFPAVAGG
jgi:molybdopterin synthase sulfur carrier subunit